VTTVDEYLASQPERVRLVLEQVREAIRSAIPQAEETLAYGMPTYKLGNKRVVHFAAWQKHYAIYGSLEPLLPELQSELARYKMETGTIQFPYSEPVPVQLIARIAELRAI
jgi:uncharacterized protein YdhG (YjbR/CyaY superfamily)